MTFSEFKEKYGIRLTDQQEAAVLRKDGYTLLLAVPGSGKTTVIVSRIGYMTECCGIPHENILTLTYSVSACRDMKERYVSVFGNSKTPQFRTIHGICALIIMEYERQYNRTSFRIMDGDTDENDILLRVFRNVYGKNPDIGSINELKRHIGYVRNMMMTDEEAKEYSDDGMLDSVLREYRRIKADLSLMDYDDQLEFAYRILLKYPEILGIFRRRFTYINVDEAQDTSKLQHEIIRLLTGSNLFMVGDEDQSIYGFRAAYPSALMDFDKTYPGAVILFMEQNFRSTKAIVQHAKQLIGNNTERRNKNMFTANSDGSEIETVSFQSFLNQFGYITDICVNAVKADEKTAILFRNNESSIPVIDILERNGIPYRMRENDCLYFSNPAVCDMLLMLKYCEDPENQEVFAEIAPKMGCGLTREKALQICYDSSKSGSSLYYEFKKYISIYTKRDSSAISLFSVIEKYHERKLSLNILLLHRDTCFGRFLDHRFSDKLKIAVLYITALKCENYTDFVNRLEFLKNKMLSGNTYTGKCVVLSTVHSSKGLEYDSVYLIDIKDGVLPGVPQSKNDVRHSIRFLEEERRLFYVGVTRAKSKLVLLKYLTEYDGSRAESSSFIRELINDKNETHGIFRKKNGEIKRSSKVQQNILPFKEGSFIMHKTFGKGKIERIDNEKCTVLFDDGTRKSISLELCVQNGIIRLIND